MSASGPGWSSSGGLAQAAASLLAALPGHTPDQVAVLLRLFTVPMPLEDLASEVRINDEQVDEAAFGVARARPADARELARVVASPARGEAGSPVGRKS